MLSSLFLFPCFPMLFFSTPVNYLAVLVAMIGAMVVGAIWYSPSVFGTAWMKLSGITPDPTKKEGMMKAMIVAALSNLVLACTLAHVFVFFGVQTLFIGLEVAFFLWLGFAAAIRLVHHVFEGKPFQLYLLNTAYDLLVMLVMGTVLSLWK